MQRKNSPKKNTRKQPKAKGGKKRVTLTLISEAFDFVKEESERSENTTNERTWSEVVIDAILFYRDNRPQKPEPEPQLEPEPELATP